MEKKRVSMPTQLVCALSPIACKVMQYMCGWSGQEFIKLYVHQMARAMNLTDDEVELAIQTLSNVNLIEIGKNDGGFVAKINAEQVQKYFNIPFQRIIESDGIPMATEVKWKQEEKKQSSNDIGDLSDDELKLLLRRIQVSLNERSQMAKCVVSNDKKNEEIDNLPF